MIEPVKSNFLRAKERLARALATTPDDRINWSPSPTARTPVQQVAHAAIAIRHMLETFDGRTFSVSSPPEADQGFREWEKTIDTREGAVELLEKHSAEYVAWLDSLTPDRLSEMVVLPFGMGSAPRSVCLAFPAAHTNDHAAQIDYIQTIYGDRDWH